MPNPLNRIPLPAWAQMDNPLVRRELETLPAFIGQDGNLNVKMLLLAVVGMGMVGCSCSCGGIWWPLLMAALGMVPLLWGAMLVNRDRATGRWDMLRVTPYSLREILLAKVTAALYRLSPLLALLLAGEVMSTLVTSWLMEWTYSAARLSVNGATYSLGDLVPAAESGFLMVWAVLLVRVMFGTLLGFVLNIVVGLLASTLTESRGWAFAGAVGMRVILTLAFSISTLLFIQVLTGGQGRLPGMTALEALGQAAGGIALASSAGLGYAVLGGMLGLLGQGLALVGVFRLAEWRAARM
ncbi:MAG: hypothetical protein JXN59_12705 [Anaerolineae bacterium]|nr:hypothetical protein [Anaerolineae bacterium]